MKEARSHPLEIGAMEQVQKKKEMGVFHTIHNSKALYTLQFELFSMILTPNLNTNSGDWLA